MFQQINIWWHSHYYKHSQRWNRVTVPMFDMSAKGYMVHCDCGKDWAI